MNKSLIGSLKHSIGSTLFRYIAKEYVFSLIVAFLFFFAIFFINQLLVIAQQILSKKVDLGKTLLLIIYAMPAIIALALPFASLVASLMTIGRFSSDNETVAFQACGINLMQVFIPILLVALAVAGFSFIANDYFLPLGTLNYVRLYQELIYSNSELIVEPYGITRFSNTGIVSSDVSQGKFGPLLLIDSDEEGRTRVISSKSAQLLKNDTQLGVVSLDLNDVRILSLSKNRSDFDESQASVITYNILLKNLTFDLNNPGPREMSSADLLTKIGELELNHRKSLKKKSLDKELAFLELEEDYGRAGQNRIDAGSGINIFLKPFLERLGAFSTAFDLLPRDRTLQLYWIEFWKKFSIPSACFTLIFFGFPAGMFARRSGKSIGFGIGFVIAVVFWSMLLAGQTIGMDNISLSPFVLMWAPNLLFLAIGVVLMIKRIVR